MKIFRQFGFMITKIIYFLIFSLGASNFLSCSKTSYKKASPIVEDNCISISNIMVLKNMDSIWELRNEEEGTFILFSKF